jgi:hypothetical protein
VHRDGYYEVITLNAMNARREAYEIRVFALKFSEAARAAVIKALETGVTATCLPWDPNWTADDVKDEVAFRVADKKVGGKLTKIARTKHFVCISSSSRGKAYAQALEDGYEDVQKFLGFTPHKHQQLMPLIVFKSKAEFDAFELDMKARTGRKGPLRGGIDGGRVMDGWYATWDLSAKDINHREAGRWITQLYAARVNGGNAWFSWGIARYLTATPQELKERARKRAQTMSSEFRPFIDYCNLDYDSFDASTEAAVAIDWLANGPKKAKWPELVTALSPYYVKGTASMDRLCEIYGMTDWEISNAVNEWLWK